MNGFSRVAQRWKRVIPLSVRRPLGNAFWWLWASLDDRRVWREQLDVLRRGDSLKPGVGLEEEKAYIRERVDRYYGSFTGLRVLGAGCGTGRMEAWLAGEGASVVCLDHLVEAVEISRIHAQRAGRAEHFVVGDLARMPFKGETFDLINSGGVLEHVVSPRDALREYFRATKPNGVIIVSVPNLVGVNAGFGLKPLFELVCRRRGSGSYVERNFSGASLRRPLEGAGFVCLDISPTLFNAFDRYPLKWLKATLSALGIYRSYCSALRVFGRRFPGIAFGYSFMIAFAQKPW